MIIEYNVESDPIELYCPNCGHDGVFDGQGPETYTQDFITNDDTKTIVETRYQMRCTACGCEFLIVEDKDVR